MSAQAEHVSGVAAVPLDVRSVRADFPILTRLVHDRPLVYLDNAASSQQRKAIWPAVVPAVWTMLFSQRL